MTSHDYGDEYGTPDVDKFLFLRTHYAPIIRAHGAAPILRVHSAARGKRCRLGNVGEVYGLGGDENFEEQRIQVLTRRQNQLLRRNPARPVTKGQSAVDSQGEVDLRV